VTELHDAAKAVEHGTSACELSGWAEPICLDVLAAAYAEAGRFNEAVQRQREAIKGLSGMKGQLMKAVFENRLARYERGVAKLPEGLVARWEFEQSQDGIAPDSSANNLHGRLVADAHVYADPERGPVLCLDGEGDWVDCGADRRFDLTEEITVSVWIKISRFDKDWQATVAKGNRSWRLQRDQTTDALEFACSGVVAVGTPRGPTAGVVRGHANVNDGQWHHVAGVYDGRRLSLYIDGELDTFMCALAFSSINTSEDHVLIGTNSGSPSPRDWNGLIDDLCIYNYALSPQDIKALHDGQEPLSD
jgi:hypothetical protein